MARLFWLVPIIFGFLICLLSKNGLAQNPPGLSTEVVVRGLDTPWAIDFAPDGRIFITERPGRIRVIEHGQLQPEPWMILEVATLGEAGLMGIALDPY
jgi:glucose/arabinose dehydrogenase